jgi:hypothetical protein
MSGTAERWDRTDSCRCCTNTLKACSIPRSCSPYQGKRPHGSSSSTTCDSWALPVGQLLCPHTDMVRVAFLTQTRSLTQTRCTPQ